MGNSSHLPRSKGHGTGLSLNLCGGHHDVHAMPEVSVFTSNGGPHLLGSGASAHVFSAFANW